MIIPESRLENVMMSLQNYLATNFTMTAIAWPGLDFDSNPVQEWIRPDLLITEGPYFRQVGNNLLGKDLHLLYNINIFGRREYIKVNTFRLIRVRDTLRDIFRETTDILVKDFITGGGLPPVVGSLRCFGCTDENLGEDTVSGLFQRNITPDLRWTEKWQQP